MFYSLWWHFKKKRRHITEWECNKTGNIKSLGTRKQDCWEGKGKWKMTKNDKGERETKVGFRKLKKTKAK